MNTDISGRSRVGDWMQVYSGRQFWPLDPDPAEIDIRDIAHHLSLICRYNGAVRFPYSVAQHSVLLARWLKDVRMEDDWVLMAGLLHDASEAYLCDIIRPIKADLAGYREIEDRLMAAVAARFDLPRTEAGFDLPEIVRTADTRILTDEREQVLGPYVAEWKAEWSLEPLGVRIERWSPERAEIEFLHTYISLSGEVW